MLARFLFGDDVFISYSRRDGAGYAAALASALSAPGRGLSCFLDQWGASAASELSPPVVRALRRSSVLVIVGTAGAAASVMVQEEIRRFSTRGRWGRVRPILVVDVGGAFAGVVWPEIAGLPRTTETERAREEGLPSEAVVRLVADSHTYARRNQRTRWLSGMAAAFLVASVSVGGLAAWQARVAQQNRTAAEAATRDAQAQAAKAEQQAALARESAEQARQEQEQTRRQTEIATARLLTAQSGLVRAQNPDQLPLSVLLAASSMKRLEALGQREATTDRTLREGLALLPVPIRTVDHGAAVTAILVGPDAARLATAGKDRKVLVWRLSDGRSAPPIAHQDVPAGIAFSPEGRYLATTDGTTLQVWDARQERVVARVDTPECGSPLASASRNPRLLGPAFSADGRRLVLACSAREARGETLVARTWDASGWREMPVVNVPRVLTAALSPDGDWLAVATHVEDATVIELRSLTLATTAVRPINVGELSVRALALSAGGKYLAVTGSIDGEPSTTVFEPRARQPRLGPLGSSGDVVFSPTGFYVATSSRGATRVYRLPERNEALTVAHEAQAPVVRFTAHGVHLVLSSGRSVRVWKIRAREEAGRLGVPDAVAALAVEPEGTARRRPVHETFSAQILRAVVATAGAGGAVRVWEFGRDAALSSLGFELSPDGRYVAEPDIGAVKLWDVASGASLAQLKPEGGNWAVAFSPNGKYVATTSREGLIAQVWELPGGRPVVRLDGAKAVAFSLDGEHLAVTRASGASVEVRALSSGARLGAVRLPGGSPAVSLGPGGRYVVFGEARRGPTVWDVVTGGPIFTEALWPRDRPLAGAVLSQDGRYLAATVDRREILVCDLLDKRVAARWRSETDLTPMAFSPDAALVALSGADGVGVWRWRADQPPPIRIRPGGKVIAVAFTPDGGHLATAVSRTAQVWDTASGQEVSRIVVGDPLQRVAFDGAGATLTTFTERWDGAESEHGVQAWPWRPRDMLARACARLSASLTADEAALYRETCGASP